MVDPLLALVVGGLLLVGAGLLLWPGRGFFWRWRELRLVSARVQLEDALKHLYNCEYARQLGTVDSLSGALQVSGNRAAEVLVQLETMGLSQRAAGSLRLTSDGRDYALRIVRVHRLWEHYLAEETGLGHVSWHDEAERQEHQLTLDEVNELDEQMGHPVYDPHGDPIPSAAGDIGPKQGFPLTNLLVAQLATIAHIEDEPEEVYARLVREGLHVGMRIEVLEASDELIRFLLDGDQRDLPPTIAANVYVVSVPAEQGMEGPFETLSSLAVNESGRVIRISPACRGLERRRLMDLGVIPGTVIGAEMKSPVGDPTAYRIRGAMIALRREQADQIHIARVMELDSGAPIAS